MIELKIDPDFDNILSPLDSHTYEMLKESIRKEGLRYSIKVWKEHNTILDGHNRYRICKELGIEPKISYLSFNSYSEAERWIIKNQCIQRNLNPKAISYSRGKFYDNHKKERGGDQKSKGKIEHSNIKQLTAKKFGISERTVINDHKFFKAVSLIEENLGETARHNLIDGRWKMSLKDLTALANNIEALNQPNSTPPKHKDIDHDEE